jgi:predicted acyl esterase
VTADLFASTTGTDADWIVKLIDVYPEQHPEDWDLAGYELMNATPTDFRAATNQIFRSARYPSHVALPVVVSTAGSARHTRER